MRGRKSRYNISDSGNFLTLLEILPNRKGVRFGKFLCCCGVVVEKSLSKVLSIKSTKSCGCKRKTHGMSNTRLYRLWDAMKQRSKVREDCNVYKPWLLSFEEFQNWSLRTGYQEDRILCRNNDSGDYSPENCRWDTFQSNNEEAHAKHYKVVKPCGAVENVYNMAKFCKLHDLNPSNMSQVSLGRLKNHKGYSCKEVSNE